MIPIGRQGDRKRIDEVTVLEIGPEPLIGFFGQAGAYGIAKDIAENGQKMLVLLDRETFEPALPNMTMTSVMLMIAADMSRQEPLHKRAEGFRCFGLDDEVEVVGHQAKTEKGNRMFSLGHGKQVKESAVVSLFMKDGCAAISPIDDMICETGDLSTWDARHEGKISQEEKQKQRKSSLSPFSLVPISNNSARE